MTQPTFDVFVTELHNAMKFHLQQLTVIAGSLMVMKTNLEAMQLGLDTRVISETLRLIEVARGQLKEDIATTATLTESEMEKWQLSRFAIRLRSHGEILDVSIQLADGLCKVAEEHISGIL